MAKQHISEGLKRFIKERIQTVLRLEVLLLLHGQQSRSFSPAEVADELGFDIEPAQEQLTALEAIGVVIQASTDEDKYKYHPANTTLGSTVDHLEMAYSRQRVSVLSAILEEQLDRIRLFSEAFRIIRRND